MIPLFDAHCDTLSYLLDSPEDTLLHSGGQWDLERLGGYAPCAQFFAVFSDSGEQGLSMWERFLQQIGLFDGLMEQYPDRITHCRNSAQAEQAAKQGKVAAFLSAEGGELLDCDPEKLELAYRMGVRAVNLTWNHANALSGCHMDESERGLSDRGRDFVRKMGELGMLVDVSHLSDPGFWDVMECTSRPVIATHSNARSIFFHTRNLTDEQITAIIKGRGVIGLNLYEAFIGAPPTGVDTAIAHLERMLDLGGEQTVALGGDWDGADPLAGGFRDVSHWSRLYDALLRRNYSKTQIENLFYNNMMRIVREVCDT